MKKVNQKQSIHLSLKQQARLEHLFKRFGLADNSYTETNKKWKNIAVFISWIVNCCSIATAFYGVFWLLSYVIQFVGIAGSVTLIFLFLSVLAQRWSSDNFWDGYWRGNVNFGWLGLSLVIMSLSLLSSAWGTYQGTLDTAPPPVLVTTDSILDFHNEQLAQIDQVIESNRKTTWKGKIVSEARKNIREYGKLKMVTLEKIHHRQQQIDEANTITKLDSEENTFFVAYTLIALYIFLELLFECCMAYSSYYDWRELCERLETMPGATDALFLDMANNIESGIVLRPTGQTPGRKIGFQIPYSEESKPTESSGSNHLENLIKNHGNSLVHQGKPHDIKPGQNHNKSK